MRNGGIMIAAAVFACDVTNIDLWIGSTSSKTENYNTADVFKCVSFGWYVEWAASGPDDDDFEGEIFIDSTSAGSFTADGEDRSASGTGSIPAAISFGSVVLGALYS